MLASESEFFALESSLEIELAEVLSVSAVDSPTTIEVEESCTSKVDFSWVIYESTHNEFLDTAAACHLFI
jgi:hypothetical protein